jgi:hypothetical protein
MKNAALRVLAAAGLIVAALPTHAQDRATGAIRGRVLDQTGAPLPDVAFALSNANTGAKRTTASNSGGYYALPLLPVGGDYSLAVSRGGFFSKTVGAIRLAAGETVSIDMALTVAGTGAEVTVVGAAEGLRSDAPNLGFRLDHAGIDHTPVVDRKLTALPLLDAAIRPARGTGEAYLNVFAFITNGGGRRGTSFSIDGSTGDDLWARHTIYTNLPLDSLQEMTVKSNSFSAEYGRTTGGVVNILTRSGSNTLGGDVTATFRPVELQAAAPLAATRADASLLQVSGSLGGPISKDRTHFFLAGEYAGEDKDAAITSPLAPGVYTGRYEQGLGLAKLDHRINDSNTLTARANFESYHDTNPGGVVGGLNLESAGREFRRKTFMAQASETAVLSGSAALESRVQFQAASPISQFDPLTPSTQFVRPGVAVEGESRAARTTNQQFELAETLSLTRGRHALRLGVDAIHSSAHGDGFDFGPYFTLGLFTIKPGVTRPVSELTINDAVRFTQAFFGKSSYDVKEWSWALFAQDAFAVRPDLTINLGLRYEQQTFTDDRNNLEPRVGVTWRPGGDQKTVLRGAFGLYHSELRSNYAGSYTINGPEGVFVFSVGPGQVGFPPTLEPLPEVPTGAFIPARDVTVRSGRASDLSQFFDASQLRGYPDSLVNPASRLFSAGIERELSTGWFASADYVGQHVWDLDRTLDLNAPAPLERTAPGQVRLATAADLTRPIVPHPGGFRRILVIMNDGVSDYNALQLKLARRASARFGLQASYTLSHSTNTVEPDTPQGQDPNDSTQLDAEERADGLLDVRHRAVIAGWWQGPAQLTLGSVVSLASGRPYNVLTGFDNNGDGLVSDRPVIDGKVVGRNSERTKGSYSVDAFIERSFRVGGERTKLSLRIESFNIFNHNNIITANNIYGNNPSGAPLSSFGQPVGGIAAAEPGRQVQGVVRLSF